VTAHAGIVDDDVGRDLAVHRLASGRLWRAPVEWS
jgi:hypothetical protein